MKNNQLIRLLCGSALVLCFAITSFAQPARKHKHRTLPQIEKFKEELNLDEDQLQQLQDIKSEMRSEFRALRQEGEAPDRETMTTLKEEYKVKIEAILTPEQQSQLKELVAEQKEKGKARREGMKAMSKELKAYQKENIRPVMLEQRQKLEQEMSPEDIAAVEKLRTALKQYKAEHKGKAQARRADRQGDAEQSMARKSHGPKGRKHRKAGLMGFLKSNTEYQSLANELIDTYSDDIERINGEIEDQVAQWEVDKKAIVDKHMGQMDEELSGKFHRKRGQKKEEFKTDRDRMKKLGFLLMRADGPEETVRASRQADRPMKIYPNPSATNQTLEFETSQAGIVMVDIIDKNGQVVRQLFNGQLEAGSHQLEVDVQDLSGFVHYYRITDANGQSTKKTLITRE
ncbi:MAG: T9SS type A sorting domain-containing protein [Bacteroidota bacterium]